MQPFRTILFAADLSENSKQAFRVACSLAVENNTRLVVLHVAEPNWAPQEPGYSGEANARFFAEKDERHHEALKRKLCEVYTPNHPLDMEYQTREGDAKVEILRTASEVGSDLIVMGTHGRTGLSWLVAGSVAIAVLRGAHCPVLAVRLPEVPRKSEDIRVILHPTDFSESSEAAAHMAHMLARDLGARLVILHVASLEVIMDGTPAADTNPGVYKDALEHVRKRLDGGDLKYPVETRISRGFTAEGILQTAEEVGCDLIVMGTHGRTGLKRALMGSVAESVLPKAGCPVLVVQAFPHGAVTTSDRPAQEVSSVN